MTGEFFLRNKTFLFRTDHILYNYQVDRDGQANLELRDRIEEYEEQFVSPSKGWKCEEHQLKFIVFLEREVPVNRKLCRESSFFPHIINDPRITDQAVRDQNTSFCPGTTTVGHKKLVQPRSVATETGSGHAINDGSQPVSNKRFSIFWLLRSANEVKLVFLFFVVVEQG